MARKTMNAPARNPELPCDPCEHGKYNHQPCEKCDTPEELAAYWPDFAGAAQTQEPEET
jgi:hypothetical protein